MTDNQFTDTFTTPGGWFILTQYETIADWNGSNRDLIEHIYAIGFDEKRARTRSRVSCVRRLIRENRIEDALIKIRDSKKINTQHPDAYMLASNILKRRFDI